MKAYIATLDGLAVVDREQPEAAPGSVVVRIRASALNRLDLKMVKGYQHGPAGGLGQIVGLEWAGDVIAVGGGVEAYAVGDRVSGMGGGGFAEQVLAKPHQLFLIPPGMSYEEAACFPVGLRTMYEALVISGALQSGQSVLIQGASSAVGLLGMQIARVLGAGLVIGTTTTAARLDELRNYGAHLALNSRDAGWVDAVLEATEGAGVDLVVDQVSGELLNQTLLATKVLGRIVNVGRLGGNLKVFDSETHAMRRISLVGTTFRSRSPAEFSVLTDGVVARLIPELSSGRIRLPIGATYAFDEIPQALDAMASNLHLGKIIISHGK